MCQILLNKPQERTLFLLQVGRGDRHFYHDNVRLTDTLVPSQLQRMRKVGGMQLQPVQKGVLKKNCTNSHKKKKVQKGALKNKITREMQGIVGQASDFVEVVSKID